VVSFHNPIFSDPCSVCPSLAITPVVRIYTYASFR
jgi:hypothetical protein